MDLIDKDALLAQANENDDDLLANIKNRDPEALDVKE